MQIQLSKLAKAWKISDTHARRRAEKNGYPITKVGAHTMVEVPDDFEEQLSDDSRYQKARADRMEQDAQIAFKKNLALNAEVAAAINMDWDEDFVSVLPILKDYLLDFLNRHKATAADRKELNAVFVKFREAYMNKREERYAERAENEAIKPAN